MPTNNSKNNIRLTVFLKKNLYNKFKKIALEDGRNMSNATRFLVRNYVAESETKKSLY